ncbi:alpha/beta fold hydrolase [Nocardia cyriacigeorgica]|uniref:alpha/beta fold hydrolase n=1 Tax=Nocardia cyriacigeorgica TaxID=135487 RepID=UPI0024564977|nr:alpha/beta fold hydrolase [Nocardia cyriacigeorgica]
MRRKHKLPALLTATLVPAALLLPACTTPPASDISTTAADLDRFYDQELQFESCDGYAITELQETTFNAVTRAECARLTVPIDYDHPDDGTTQLAVTRMAARGDTKGSVVVNSGGPGGSGQLQAVIASAGFKDTPITEQYDIVGIDPRGVSASSPAIDCISDEQTDDTGFVFPAGVVQGSWTAADTQEIAEECTRRTGSEQFIAEVGTPNVARDMDILRAALGDEKLTYIGQSYGTRLGAVYAEMFPSNVRALVLDGAQDPTLETAQRKVTQYAGFQRSFDLMADSCTREPDCVLGQDRDQALRRFQEIVRPLIDTPASTVSGRPVDFNTAIGAVIGGLYQSTTWPDVQAGIAELTQGKGDTLLALSDGFAERGSDGVWSNYLEANVVINCMDEQRRTPEQEERLRAKIWEEAPFLDPGESIEGARDGCEAMPGDTELTYPYAQDISGLPETLTISITGDPTTPYAGGVALAESLGGALLTVEGEQHTIAMSGASICVNDVVSAYIIDLEIPDEGAACTLG